MLATRLATGLTLVAALLAVLILDERLAPWFPLWFLTSTVMMALASMELVGLLGATSVKPSGNTVLGGTMALVVANWAPHLVRQLNIDPERPIPVDFDPSAMIDVMAWPLWTFVAVMMAAFFSQSLQFRRPGQTMATLAGTILAIAYVGLLGGFIIQIRWFDGPYHGLIPLTYLVATAKGSDTGAYTMGRIAGRHKLWPSLSPNKTIEGAIGGLAFGVGAALIVTSVAKYALDAPGLEWGESVGFGLIVAATAQLGDLMESMIKRDCERKDASSAVPGFGGILDVLDSLLFAAPVAYGFWNWFGP
ncbi:phosphatidate cytidylyltransferase [Tundrisphaera lichenicola]|uniref:phosphatidate cytidylyltransferase n=1 Tax=Tundrisphaera lichenicola TaxID=2029860 RepID=UPI003EBBF8F3